MELLWAIYKRPEGVGTIVNDQLATFLVVRLCLPDKEFIDVGAHIGSILSEVIRYDPSIKLYAVEPIPEKIDSLRRKFPAIQVFGCALGESEGEAAFFENTKHSGYSSLGRPANSVASIEKKVPLRTLDGLISSKKIDVIKIDVEGAELGVLRGGNDLIAANRPLVLFESGPPKDDGLGYTKELMWQWLDEHNFDVVLPNRVAHDGPGLSLDGFVESHVYPRRTTNYFAIPKERRIQVRDRARSVLKILAT
jgi:FkbM family methyltransferase